MRSCCGVGPVDLNKAKTYAQLPNTAKLLFYYPVRTATSFTKKSIDPSMKTSTCSTQTSINAVNQFTNEPCRCQYIYIYVAMSPGTTVVEVRAMRGQPPWTRAHEELTEACYTERAV